MSESTTVLFESSAFSVHSGIGRAPEDHVEILQLAWGSA
jgi:hypothetical protein